VEDARTEVEAGAEKDAIEAVAKEEEIEVGFAKKCTGEAHREVLRVLTTETSLHRERFVMLEAGVEKESQD